MGLATRVLLASLLMVMDVRAQSQGLELSLDRDIISMGDQEQVGELTCKANGNDVTVESVSVIWVNITGESSDVVTVTTTKPEHSVALDGILGNGTLENNSGYIVLNQMDAAICGSSYFLCEVTFTKPSGERERAIATAWPRQPRGGEQDVEKSNQTQHLMSLKKRVEDMSQAFEMFNSSFADLLETRRKEQLTQAKLLKRLAELENKTSMLSGPKSCDACFNVSQALYKLKTRLEKLEEMKNPDQKTPMVCERGMNETTTEPFLILPEPSIGRKIRCDAQTDGGGWIVFQRRLNGVQNFDLNWANFREGFGNLSTEFWLGNEALYNLTNQNAYELRVDVRTKNGQDLYNTYTSFKIENETALYTLRLGSLSGGTIGEVPGRGFSYHNNMAFSTPDRDNDKLSSENCAALDTNGSFWNNKCSYVAPNAVYDNLAWHNGNIARGLVSIEMKLRRRA